MRSRQYLVYLPNLDKMLAWRVYSDRSVEEGRIINGEFVRQECRECNNGNGHTRSDVANHIQMARDFGYQVLKERL